MKQNLSPPPFWGCAFGVRKGEEHQPKGLNHCQKFDKIKRKRKKLERKGREKWQG